MRKDNGKVVDLQFDREEVEEVHKKSQQVVKSATAVVHKLLNSWVIKRNGKLINWIVLKYQFFYSPLKKMGI